MGVLGEKEKKDG
jgi:hypothetical protein